MTTNSTLSTDQDSVAEIIGLGGQNAGSELDLVEHVESGLSLASLDRVAKALGLDETSVKYSIVPKASYARMRAAKRRLSVQQSEKVVSLAEIIAAARAIWGEDRAAISRFLDRPHPLLRGRTPQDVALQSTVGANAVVDLLRRAQAGVAV